MKNLEKTESPNKIMLFAILNRRSPGLRNIIQKCAENKSWDKIQPGTFSLDGEQILYSVYRRDDYMWLLTSADDADIPWGCVRKSYLGAPNRTLIPYSGEIPEMDALKVAAEKFFENHYLFPGRFPSLPNAQVEATPSQNSENENGK